MKERLEREGVRPVEVIPNCCIQREKRPPLGDEPIFGYAGRLSYEKGVDTLIRAFAKAEQDAPTARLWIAGDGPESTALKRLTRECNQEHRIEFLGALPFEEMDLRFEKCWAQIVPSVWDEPFGMVAVEGIIRGCAVI